MHNLIICLISICIFGLQEPKQIKFVEIYAKSFSTSHGLPLKEEDIYKAYREEVEIFGEDSIQYYIIRRVITNKKELKEFQKSLQELEPLKNEWYNEKRMMTGRIFLIIHYDDESVEKMGMLGGNIQIQSREEKYIDYEAKIFNVIKPYLSILNISSRDYPYIPKPKE